MPVVPQRVLRPTNQAVRGGGANLQPLFQGGNELGAGLEKAQAKQQKHDLTQAQNDYMREVNNLMLGEGGQKTLSGRAYVNKMTETRSRLEQLRTEHVQRLGEVHGEDFGVLFDQWADGTNILQAESMDTRGVKEKDTADLLDTATSIQEFQQFGIAGEGDENITLDMMGEIEARTKELAEIRGITEEQTIKSMVEVEQAKMHKGIVDRLLASGQIDEAKSYIEHWRGSVDPDVLSGMLAQVNKSGDLAAGFDLSDEARAAHPGDAQAQQDYIRDNAATAEIRQAASQLADTQSKRDHFAQQEQHNAAVDQVITRIRKGETRAEISASSPDLYEAAVQSTADEANYLALEKATAEGRIYSSVDEEGLMLKFERMTSEELIKENPEQYYHRLTRQSASRLDKMIGGAVEALDREAGSFGIYDEADQLLSQFAPYTNFGKRKGDDREIDNAIRNDVHGFIHGYKAANDGKNPTQEELSQFVQDAFLREEGRWYNFLGIGERRYKGHIRDSLEKGDIESVPDEWQKEYKTILGERNLPMDNDIITELYRGEITPGDAGVAIQDEAIAEAERRARGGGPQSSVNPKDPLASVVEGSSGAEIVDRTFEAMLGLEDRHPEETSVVTEVVEKALAPFKIRSAQEADVPGQKAILPPKPKPEIQGAMSMTRFFEAGRDSQGFSRVDTRMYKDTKGIPTIGVGFNLNRKDARAKFEALGYDFDKVKSGKQAISEKDGIKLFQEDWEQSLAEAGTIVPQLDQQPTLVRNVVVDMVFNMGINRVKGFKGFLAAVQAGDYAGAAGHLRWVNGKGGSNTGYWNDTGRRAERHYRALLTLAR